MTQASEEKHILTFTLTHMCALTITHIQALIESSQAQVIKYATQTSKEMLILKLTQACALTLVPVYALTVKRAPTD